MICEFGVLDVLAAAADRAGILLQDAKGHAITPC